MSYCETLETAFEQAYEFGFDLADHFDDAKIQIWAAENDTIAMEVVYMTMAVIQGSLTYTYEFIPLAESVSGDDFGMFEDMIMAFEAGAYDALFSREFGVNMPN